MCNGTCDPAIIVNRLTTCTHLHILHHVLDNTGTTARADVPLLQLHTLYRCLYILDDVKKSSILKNGIGI